MSPSGVPVVGLYGLPTSNTSDVAQSCPSSPPISTASTSTSSDSTSTSEHSFMDPIAMPPPGVAHFEARRARWLTPPEGWEAHEPSPSTSRAKLEALLASEDAISNDDIWNAGIRNVWNGLVGGGRLRRRLPLGIVLKILQAGWLRDGTWPADAAGTPLQVTYEPPNPVLIPPTESRSGGHSYGDNKDDVAE